MNSQSQGRFGVHQSVLGPQRCRQSQRCVGHVNAALVDVFEYVRVVVGYNDRLDGLAAGRK